MKRNSYVNGIAVVSVAVVLSACGGGGSDGVVSSCYMPTTVKTIRYHRGNSYMSDTNLSYDSNGYLIEVVGLSTGPEGNDSYRTTYRYDEERLLEKNEYRNNELNEKIFYGYYDSGSREYNKYFDCEDEVCSDEPSYETHYLYDEVNQSKLLKEEWNRQDDGTYAQYQEYIWESGRVVRLETSNGMQTDYSYGVTGDIIHVEDNFSQRDYQYDDERYLIQYDYNTTNYQEQSVFTYLFDTHHNPTEINTTRNGELEKIRKMTWRGFSKCPQFDMKKEINSILGVDYPLPSKF